MTLDPRITEKMDQLRSRIRRYVWIEGIAVGVVWLCLTFWLGLAIDYLPVRMGSNEMPRSARVGLLVVISLALMVIIYRFVLRRAFAQLRTSNLAVLIERAFPEFRDSLVTTVECADSPPEDEVSKELLDRAGQDAAARIQTIDVDRVFNYRPLVRSCAMAILLTASIVCFGFFANTAFAVWVQRLYGLSDELYPRRNQIEALDFKDRELTVARGSDLRLRVRADANRSVPPPKVCTVFYATEKGIRGRANMSRQGEVQDGYQYYLYDGKPFRNILSDVEFDLAGGDHRISNYRVRVVDSPQVTHIDVDYSTPAYTELLPRNESYRNGMQLVRGTNLAFTIHTNKPVTHASFVNVTTDELNEIPLPEPTQQFTYAVDVLQGALAHEISLTDIDGIDSSRPYRIQIGAIQDQVPEVVGRLTAIGSAITKDARLPIVGNVHDDFGLQRCWISLATDEKDLELPAVVAPDESLDTFVDLRDLARDDEAALQLQEGQQLILSIKAMDKCNFESDGNIGESDIYQLEVVTASQLMAMLEAREFGLRSRFEQIIAELTQTRNSMAQIDLTPIENSAAEDTSQELPADADEMEEVLQSDASSGPQSQTRRDALNLLRVQRAFQHSERAAQEVRGVALSFDDIRLELINNRVDSADRQKRISNDIVAPLTTLVDNEFPRLSDRLQEFEASIKDTEAAASLRVASIGLLDELLDRLKSVRDKMKDLESYNELVERIRALIREQDRLLEETKQKQKDSARRLLE